MYIKVFYLDKLCLILAISLTILLSCTHNSFASNTDANNTNTASKEHRLAPASQAVFPHIEDVEASFDDYDDEIISIADPIEPWNRFWFQFNDIFYMYLASPLYKGYEAVTPSEFRLGLKNFLSNTLFPVRFLNNLLQGKLQAAGVEYGRFVINTTVGLGGLIDVAKDLKTVVPVDPAGENFGKTLAYWGVGDGFYLVLPIIGPSTLRDSVGIGVDTLTDPFAYVIKPYYVPFLISTGLRFNTVGDILTLYDDLKLFSVDPYVAARSAYATYRFMRIQR